MIAGRPLTVRVYRLLHDCWPVGMTVNHIAAELGQPSRAVSRAVQSNEAAGMVKRSVSRGVRGAMFQART